MLASENFISLLEFY